MKQLPPFAAGRRFERIDPRIPIGLIPGLRAPWCGREMPRGFFADLELASRKSRRQCAVHDVPPDFYFTETGEIPAHRLPESRIGIHAERREAGLRSLERHRVQCTRCERL